MDDEIVANLKSLSIDMINKAGSGHPGVALSAAPILYTVYANHMHINPKDPEWLGRDRFVLSAGHASSLLYSNLYMLDYLTLEDLKKFRQIGSLTPGHPEYGVTKGVDISTGPLGSGLASSVGMALALKHLKTKINIIDNYVYVLCGDGDLMEGVSYEASSLAGTLKLDNLIILYDSNNISLDGSTSMTFDEDVRERFDAMGFYTTIVHNGHSTGEIDKAIRRAKKSGLPSLIEVKTTIGAGSLLEGTNEVHGKPLTEKDIVQLKRKLKVKDEAFWTNDEAIKKYRDKVMTRSNKKYEEWQVQFNEYMNRKDIKNFLDRKIELNITENPFNEIVAEATRDSASKILNFLSDQSDLFFGGSADLASSTKTYLNGKGDFSKDNYSGSNIRFGVREHAMGAILNGIATVGYFPFGSTFFAFSDYLKPAMRMSALMNLPVTYIFTHDSIYVGEDGPTHQPIEQLSNVRSIPNMTVYRPADFKETLGTFITLTSLKKPNAVILTRQKVNQLKGTNPREIINGAYIVKKEKETANAIFIASGSEVALAINIASELEKDGYDIRVVSMPSVELFLKKPKNYIYNILKPGVKTFFIEASLGDELRRFVSNDKYLITLNSFGTSGKYEDVLESMNFSQEQIKQRIEKLL